MFTLQCYITIGSLSGLTPSAVKVRRSVSDMVDTCEITFPLTPFLKQDNTDGTPLPIRELVISEGERVSVTMGYDDDVVERFAGYVVRINKSVPMTVYCEGYSYVIKKKVLNKSYRSTTVREILQDLTEGVDVRVSRYTADVAVEAVTFRNTPGMKVLEWLQKELLCSVYFDGSEIYAGATPYSIPKPTVTYRLGWNTVDDKELQQAKEPDGVVITLVDKDKKGTVKKTRDADAKYSNVKEVKIRPGMPESFKKKVAAFLQSVSDYVGYSGNITAFLTPYCDKGYTVAIDDRRYPERSGKYFAEEVETTFGSGGGRQKIKLVYYGKELQ